MQLKLQFHHFIQHLKFWDQNGFERLKLDIHQDQSHDINRAISIAYGMALSHRNVFPPIFNFTGERILNTTRNTLPTLPRSSPQHSSNAVVGTSSTSTTSAPPTATLLGANISLAGRRENVDNPSNAGGGVQIINSRDISSKVVSGQLDVAKMKKLREHLEMELRSNRIPHLDSLVTPDSLSFLSSKLAAHGKIPASDIVTMN